jgi:hypothetical protein
MIDLRQSKAVDGDILLWAGRDNLYFKNFPKWNSPEGDGLGGIGRLNVWRSSYGMQISLYHNMERVTLALLPDYAEPWIELCFDGIELP